MKYLSVSKERTDPSVVFLFPRKFDTEEAFITIGKTLRNQTFGSWERHLYDLSDGDGVVLLDSGKLNITPEGIVCKRLEITHQTQLPLDTIQRQLNNEMKYIHTVCEDEHHDIFLFPKHIHHNAFAEVVHKFCMPEERYSFRKVLSAGFVNSKMECFGSSETLNVKANAKEDTKLLREQLSLN